MKTNKLSKIIGFGSVIVMLMACNEAPAENEVVIVPPVTIAPVVIEKEPASNSTTITVDKKGVKIEAEKE